MFCHENSLLMNRKNLVYHSLWLVPVTALVINVLIQNMTRGYVNGGGPQSICRAERKFIEATKEQWALEHKATKGTSVTWSNLVPDYIRPGWGWGGKSLPQCPSGGVYQLGAIGTPLRCSLRDDEHLKFVPPLHPPNYKLWIAVTLTALPALFTVTCTLWPARRKTS